MNRKGQIGKELEKDLKFVTVNRWDGSAGANFSVRFPSDWELQFTDETVDITFAQFRHRPDSGPSGP
jgi:hypothetical protein